MGRKIRNSNQPRFPPTLVARGFSSSSGIRIPARWVTVIAGYKNPRYIIWETKKNDSVKKIDSLTLKKLIFLRQKMSMAGGILDRFSRGAILFFYKAPRRNRHETPNIYFSRFLDDW